MDASEGGRALGAPHLQADPEGSPHAFEGAGSSTEGHVRQRRYSMHVSHKKHAHEMNLLDTMYKQMRALKTEEGGEMHTRRAHDTDADMGMGSDDAHKSQLWQQYFNRSDITYENAVKATIVRLNTEQPQMAAILGLQYDVNTPDKEKLSRLDERLRGMLKRIRRARRESQAEVEDEGTYDGALSAKPSSPLGKVARAVLELGDDLEPPGEEGGESPVARVAPAGTKRRRPAMAASVGVSEDLKSYIDTAVDGLLEKLRPMLERQAAMLANISASVATMQRDMSGQRDAGARGPAAASSSMAL